MAKIHELSPHIADLIAAGEVVERPGSVVKELIENAIDAGATAITVEIKAGGMTYIRVTDNGYGMDEEDAQRAFLRHATSKLRGERDLECIGTLGFRGEALAAISAVSRIDLMTRETEAGEGTSITVEGGEISEKSPAGCPEGTTIIVRDLFYNTPARLKFMKSDKVEGGNVTQVILRCAMSQPEVSVRYIKDGEEKFHTPGDGSVRSCIYILLGREFAGNMLETEGGDEDVKVSGFVSIPAAGRGNRANQYFFINGRYIKSKLLQAALEQAYKNAMFTGKFPSCVLHIELKLGAVDVNVHPTKTEVKFLQEKRVFDAVYYSVLSALNKSQKMPGLQVTGRLKADLERSVPERADSPNGDGSAVGSTGNSDGNRIGIPTFPEKSGYVNVNDSAGRNIQTILDSKYDITGRQNTPRDFDKNVKSTSRERNDIHTQVSHSTIPTPDERVADGNNGTIEESRGGTEAMLCNEDSVPWRIVGEAMCTYIIVEQGDRLVLIDKHAAHERILFDKMRSDRYDPMPQLLITPFVVDLGPEDTAILLENTGLLSGYGFEVDQFGQGSVAVRQVPGNLGGANLDGLLSEICQKLRHGHMEDPAAMRDEVLHTIACKAAIKTGKRSDASELSELIEPVLSGQVQYCPHGRPVSIEITKSSLDRNFKRT